MGQRVDVYVLDRDGDPVLGTTVTIDIKGIWKGGTLEADTDEDGHAEFETHLRRLRGWSASEDLRTRRIFRSV